MTERVLVLGGSGWLGGQVARAALERGSAVTCLARGRAGAVPEGATHVVADRSRPGAYDAVRRAVWDAVIDVSWQPGLVRSALVALSHRVGHWIYVSSCSVYADDDIPGQDETAPRHRPLAGDEAAAEDYASAKVRCEDLVADALGDRAVLARSGLIGGPGDPSDRFGYWVARFALANDQAVLVPDSPQLSVQCVDVRDLASWLVAAAGRGVRGPVNVVGERHPFVHLLERAAVAAGFRGSMVRAEPTWLVEHDVAPWSGPRSLPLWLSMPQYAGFMTRDDSQALASGLRRRSLDEMLGDALSDERTRGIGRERRAGLDRADELRLIGELTARTPV